MKIKLIPMATGVTFVFVSLLVFGSATAFANDCPRHPMDKPLERCDKQRPGGQSTGTSPKMIENKAAVPVISPDLPVGD